MIARHKRWAVAAAWTIVVVAALVLAMLLGACGDAPESKPAVCATYQAPDGTWMEEDNEPVDADPCDMVGDDEWEWGFDSDGHRVHKPVKKLPAKPAKPIGGKTKRF